MRLTELLLDSLHRTRHVYRCIDLPASYSEDSGIILTTQCEKDEIHEKWHKDAAERKVSSRQGLGIEECTALLFEALETEDHASVARYLVSSFEFIKLYRRILEHPECSAGINQDILRVAKSYSYHALMQEDYDPRLSPWAYFADEMNYLLYYLLCHDIAKQGLSDAKGIFMSAMRRVKETKSLDEGIGMLLGFASSEMRKTYDFPAFESYEDYPKVLPATEGKSYDVAGSGLEFKLYSSDGDVVSIVLGVLNSFERETGQHQQDLLTA
ncbi:hypothetical protein HZB90_04550 [archaeon]|nr:hypothetical protein [archaeon]